MIDAHLPGEARVLLDLAVPELTAAGAETALTEARLMLARAQLRSGDLRHALDSAELARTELTDQGRTAEVPLATEIVLRARLRLDPPGEPSSPDASRGRTGRDAPGARACSPRWCRARATSRRRVIRRSPSGSPPRSSRSTWVTAAPRTRSSTGSPRPGGGGGAAGDRPAAGGGGRPARGVRGDPHGAGRGGRGRGAAE
nr:hypothetical protein GCM10020093_044690 [Planobispora longispora]